MYSFACTVLLSGALLSAEWARFRGPNGSGIGDASKLPVHFGPASNVAWRTPLPPGHSSPVIWGDRIYVTAAELGTLKDLGLNKTVDEGGRLYTICLERRTGKVLWRREAPRPRVEVYQRTNSPASPTPAADARGVYVFFGDFGLLAYGHDGNERWRMPLGPFDNVNGHGSSPIVVDDLVVLLCDQDTNSYLLAVNKETGRVAWKANREVTRSYVTPAVLNAKELIVPGANELSSYSVRTGERLWRLTGFSWQPKSTPVIAGDTLYAHWFENGGESEAPVQTPSFKEIVAKYDVDKDGKIAEKEIAGDPQFGKGFQWKDLDHDGLVDERDWEAFRGRRDSRNALLAVRDGKVLWSMQKFLPNAPSPLLYQGVLYLIKDGGILTTVDAKRGRILKQGRLTGALDPYFASPVAGAGYVYLLSQHGKLTVIKAGDPWEIVAMNDFEEECFATPAIAGNSLYVRTRSALYCFRAPE